jgi:hypothetical protein
MCTLAQTLYIQLIIATKYSIAVKHFIITDLIIKLTVDRWPFRLFLYKQY